MISIETRRNMAKHLDSLMISVQDLVMSNEWMAIQERGTLSLFDDAPVGAMKSYEGAALTICTELEEANKKLENAIMLMGIES